MGLNDEIRAAVKWDVAHVNRDDTLRDAILKMAETRSTGLVVKADDAVIGVVTDMDLLRAADAGDDLDQTTVAKFMTACELITDRPAKVPCVQLHETQSVRNAIGVMVIGGVHNLLVSGEDGKYVGMLSAIDVLRLAGS